MSCKAIENFLGVRNLKLKELKSHKPFVGMMILLGVCILALDDWECEVRVCNYQPLTTP